MRPHPAAHPHLPLIRKYPPPPGGEDYTTGDDHVQESDHRSSLLKRDQDTYIYFMEDSSLRTISELQYV